MTKRDRIDWLLTAIHAVEDLILPKLEARRREKTSGPERERDEELRICLEQLRVAAEELTGLRERLATERQRYVELFDFAPGPYLETDAHWNVRAANRAAANLLKCGEEQLVGKPLGLFFEEASRRHFRARLDALAEAAAGDVAQFETLVQPRGADAVRAVVRACIARDRNGRVSGARCLITAQGVGE